MKTHFTITPGIENRLRAWVGFTKRGVLSEKAVRPCITISREFGCQAYPLAETLFKRLHKETPEEAQWVVLDRLLLEKIAQESGYSKTGLEYTTQASPLFETLVNTFMGEEHADPFVVFKYIKKTVLYFARAGNSIIVGRGGVVLTQEMPHALHVRLMAPMAFKVKIIMQGLGMSEEEARTHIYARQGERDDFIKHFTTVDLSDPHLYHLLINNEKFSIDDMADIIVDRVKRMQS